jgi:hypothetical protein
MGVVERSNAFAVSNCWVNAHVEFTAQMENNSEKQYLGIIRKLLGARGSVVG